MKKVFYTFGLLAISLMSCESNSDDGPILPINNNSILPTKVDIAYSDGSTETIQYTYSGMTLIKEESSEGYYTDFIYGNNKLTDINFYDAPNDPILESYTYDTQGRIATISTNIVGVGVYDYSLAYSANNTVITTTSTTIPGNPTDVLTISNENIATYVEGGIFTNTYTYDTQNAPFKNITNRNILRTIDSENNSAIFFTLNNLLTEDIQSTSVNENYTYTYTYTTDGFPRIATENDGGDLTTYTYTYNND